MFKALLIFIIICSIAVNVQAHELSLSVCKQGNRYQFSIQGEKVMGWWFNNASSYDLEKLTAGNAGAELVVYTEGGSTQSIFASVDSPHCNTDKNLGNVPSIPIEMTTDCAYVEVQDPYGNWHKVQSNGRDVLLRYGQSLIGSHEQSANPDDYRAIPTACY
jgi:hypothetical protein